MPILGFMTPKESKRVMAQIEAMKLQLDNLPDWLYQTAESERYNIGNPERFAAPQELYRKLAWITQCVEITANSGALSRFDVKRVIANKEPKDIPNHPFELLLMRPNPLDSRFEFLHATIASYKLTGNAYWFINATNENAEPDELWLIPSHMIIPVPDGNSYLQGYLYYPGNGREILLQPWQILHFRRFNPFSRFIGLSAVEAIAIEAGIDLGMQAWSSKLFRENNGRLPGILTFEQMIANPIWEKIKEDTREAANKRELLMLRGVGAGGVNWQQATANQKDMEFLASREFTQKVIYNTLAPGLFAWLSENSTMSNSSSNRAAFSELTIYPMHVMMAEKISNEILPRYAGRPLVGAFEDVRISDRDMELREIVEYSKTHTVEEVRQKYWSDDPLDDERDKMLVSEADTYKTAKDSTPPAPPQLPGGQTPQDKPVQQPMMQADPQQKQNDIYRAELAKYERKALKNIGKNMDEWVGNLPAQTKTYIKLHIPFKSEAAVKATFEQAREQLKLEPYAETNEAATLLKGMELSLKALELQQ